MNFNQEKIAALDAVNFPEQLRSSIVRFYSEQDILKIAYEKSKTSNFFDFFEVKESLTYSDFWGDWAICGEIILKKGYDGEYYWENSKDFFQKRRINSPVLKVREINGAYMHLRGAVVVRMDGGEHGHYLIPLVESIVGRAKDYTREFGIGYRVGKGLLWEELKSKYNKTQYIYNNYASILDAPIKKEWGDVAIIQSVHVEQIAAIFYVAEQWGTDIDIIKKFVAPPGIEGLYWIVGNLKRRALTSGKGRYRTLGIINNPATLPSYNTPWGYFDQLGN